MEKNIQKDLEIIEEANNLFKTLLEGNRQKESCHNMRKCRCKLKRKKFALEGNPAAAMYGESQAGKSYLVSALLSEKGKPFKIFDGDGNEYDFKNQINPRGNEMESTSVVTRFSTKYKSENQNFPVIAKLLSPTDIILVICEAYYNNLKVNKPLSFDELKEKINSFEINYKNKPECQHFIIDDDIDYIEEYFDNNFSKLVYNNIKQVEKIGLWENSKFIPGFRLGYVYQPQFIYGFGLRTGLNLDTYISTSDDMYDDYGSYYWLFYEMAFNVPIHAEYRLHLSEKFSIFFETGPSIDLGLFAEMESRGDGDKYTESNLYGKSDWGYPSKRFNYYWDFSGGIRIKNVQFQIGTSRGLNKVTFDDGWKVRQNRNLSLGISWFL